MDKGDDRNMCLETCASLGRINGRDGRRKKEFRGSMVESGMHSIVTYLFDFAATIQTTTTEEQTRGTAARLCPLAKVGKRDSCGGRWCVLTLKFRDHLRFAQARGTKLPPSKIITLHFPEYGTCRTAFCLRLCW